MTIPSAKLWMFLLVMVRLSGLMAFAPFFSSALLNPRSRLALLIALSLFMAASLPATVIRPLDSAGTLIPVLAQEFMAGLLLSAGFHIAMAGMSIAGELIGLQMGLGSASLFDPNSGQDGGLMSNFFVGMFIVLFLSLDGHHNMLRELFESYRVIPPGEAVCTAGALETVIGHSNEMLLFGLRLAAPVVIPLLLLTVTVALISRAFPQAGVISIVYGVGTLLGLLLLAATTPGLNSAVLETVKKADGCAYRVLQALTAG